MEIDFTCIVDSCSNMGNSKSAGYCYGHYEMIRRYGTAMPTMICPEPTCQKSFVYQGNSRRNHRSSKRVPYCEECCNLLVKFDSIKISNLAQISKIAHLKMFVAQDFKCKICKEKRLNFVLTMTIIVVLKDVINVFALYFVIDAMAWSDMLKPMVI